jgi:outer membrane protein OmpA-like peptidoglycan-associated protein
VWAASTVEDQIPRTAHFHQHVPTARADERKRGKNLAGQFKDRAFAAQHQRTALVVRLACTLAIGAQLAFSRFLAIEVSALKDSEKILCCVVLGALLGSLLTGCAGLRIGQGCAPTPIVATDDTQSAPGWVADRLTRVAPDLHFDLSEHSLRARERDELARITPDLKEILRAFPDLIIVVEGHCDDRGLAEYNLQLGKQRADAVQRVLVNLGFPANHLRSVSLGEKRPQCLTQDEACRQKNRCVRLRAAQRRDSNPQR